MNWLPEWITGDWVRFILGFLSLSYLGFIFWFLRRKHPIEKSEGNKKTDFQKEGNEQKSVREKSFTLEPKKKKEPEKFEPKIKIVACDAVNKRTNHKILRIKVRNLINENLNGVSCRIQSISSPGGSEVLAIGLPIQLVIENSEDGRFTIDAMDDKLIEICEIDQNGKHVIISPLNKPKFEISEQNYSFSIIISGGGPPQEYQFSRDDAFSNGWWRNPLLFLESWDKVEELSFCQAACLWAEHAPEREHIEGVGVAKPFLEMLIQAFENNQINITQKSSRLRDHPEFNFANHFRITRDELKRFALLKDVKPKFLFSESRDKWPVEDI